MPEKFSENKKTVQSTAVVASLCLAAALLFFLSFITVFSSDDYLYSTFLNNGIAGFLHNMAEHYESFNGRSLVHGFAAVILHFGTWFFAVCALGLTLAAGVFGGKLLGSSDKKWRMTAIFISLVLLLPRGMMVQGFLWISAFSNYVLPSALVVLLLYLTDRNVTDEEPKAWRLILGLAMSFLCGATTEQSGVVAIAATGIYTLWCMVNDRKKLRYAILTSLLSETGLLTILFSPATLVRMREETGGGLAETFIEGLKTQRDIFAGSYTLALAVTAMFLCLGLVYYKLTGKKALSAVMGVAPCAFTVGAVILRGLPESASYLAVLALMAAVGVMLLFEGKRPLAVLLMLPPIASGIMLFTESSDYRTMLPFAIYCGLILSYAAAELLPEKLAGWGTAAIALVAALYIGVQLPHYFGNWQVERENRENAKSGAELYYRIDYDMDYTHFKPYSTMYFRSKYLEMTGRHRFDTVYFYGEGLPVVYFEGERAYSPAMRGEDGEWLVGLLGVMKAAGAKIDTELGLIEYGGMNLHYVDYGGSAVGLFWTDDSGEAKEAYVPTIARFHEPCVPPAALTRVFGFTVTYSEGRIDITE